MAQSPKEKTQLGINAYRERPTQNLPVKWEKWKQDVTLSIMSKMNVDLEDQLQENQQIWYYQTNL